MVGGTSTDSVKSLTARGNAAGKTHNQRHLQRRFVATVLFEAAVLSQAVAVIGHVDHQRIVFQLQFTQASQHHPDIAVQVIHRSVIGRDDALFFGGAKVAEDERDLASVFGPYSRDRKIRGQNRSRSSTGKSKGECGS